MSNKKKDTLPIDVMLKNIKHCVRLMSTGMSAKEAAKKSNLPNGVHQLVGGLLLSCGLVSRKGVGVGTVWTVTPTITKVMWEAAIDAVYHRKVPKTHKLLKAPKQKRVRPAKPEIPVVSKTPAVEETSATTFDLLLESAFIQKSVAAVLESNAALFMAASEENKILKEANSNLEADVEIALELARAAETRTLCAEENVRAKDAKIEELLKIVEHLQKIAPPPVEDFKAKIAELEAKNENLELLASKASKMYNELAGAIKFAIDRSGGKILTLTQHALETVEKVTAEK